MEHDYETNLTNDEREVINRFILMDLSVPEEFYCEHNDDKVSYLGYTYVKKINYNNNDYIVRLSVNDNRIRIINSLTIICNDIKHYIDLSYNIDINNLLLSSLPEEIDSYKLDDYNISYILKNKRFNELENFDDNLYFVDDYYRNDWFYHSEYKTIKRQLIEYLERNKTRLTEEEINIINKYISMFNRDNKVVYERQFNYYFNKNDESTLEKIFIKK